MWTAIRSSRLASTWSSSSSSSSTSSEAAAAAATSLYWQLDAWCSHQGAIIILATTRHASAWTGCAVSKRKPHMHYLAIVKRCVTSALNVTITRSRRIRRSGNYCFQARSQDFSGGVPSLPHPLPFHPFPSYSSPLPISLPFPSLPLPFPILSPPLRSRTP